VCSRSQGNIRVQKLHNLASLEIVAACFKMVEGPGATRNGRKVQTAVGKFVVATPRISEAESSASQETLAPSTLPPHLAGELSGCILEEAFTVGKELFLIFTPRAIENSTPSLDSNALRLHFGMNGSLNVRRVKSNDVQKRPSGVAPWKQKNDPTLRLYLVEGSYYQPFGASNYIIVEAWDTTVTYPTSAMNARNKLVDLGTRDACSTLFHAQSVFDTMRQSGNNLIISDALLNQDIFPGVGNIIKIESLHRSKIDPRRIVSSLTDAELRRIIRFTRQFSMNWLKSGRAGPKLVYNQTTCQTCRGLTVKMQKIGGGSSNNGTQGHAFMSRVTFWCTLCQPFHVTKGNNDKTSSHSASNLGNRAGNENNPNNATATANIKSQTQCPQHGQRSIKLCRVRKGGQNMLRIFYTCKIRGCNYFHWADAPFSNCRCGRKAILRVSKTEKSGGRWFLCCASGDRSTKGNASNGCGHFEWAKDNHLEPIRSLLTPLL